MVSYIKEPNLLNTWQGLGGEKLTPFSGSVNDSELNGAKAEWLDKMFRAVGGMPDNNSLSGFSRAGNTLKAEIAMAYFSLVYADDSTLADRFILGYRLTPNHHPDYVSRTKCYG